MSKELRRLQQSFRCTCENLDTNTLALLLNTIKPGIDWRGSTKWHMLADITQNRPEAFMDRLTARHAKAAELLAETVAHHRRNISTINASHRHAVALLLEKINNH